jgi:hypothetical protein
MPSGINLTATKEGLLPRREDQWGDIKEKDISEAKGTAQGSF